MDDGEINTRRSRSVAGGAWQHLFLFCRWIAAIQHLYLWARYSTHQLGRGRIAASGDRHWHWRGQPCGGISFGGEKRVRAGAAPLPWDGGCRALSLGLSFFFSSCALASFAARLFL